MEADDRAVLQKLIGKHTEKASIVLRAKIILMADEGVKYQDIAHTLDIRKDTVTDWADQRENFIDSCQQHCPQVNGQGGHFEPASDRSTVASGTGPVEIACSLMGNPAWAVTAWRSGALGANTP